jgi:peptide/nickel transport system substrate-binding protein
VDPLRRVFRSRKLIVVALVVAVVATACDSDDEERRAGDDKIPVGGTLNIAGVGRLDFLDPAAMYSPTSWFLARGVYRTLVTYPATSDPARQTSLVPDLATDVGTPNSDATSWTFELRDGIKYGPAVGGKEIEGVTGADITAPDIKYGLERLFLDSVNAGYAFHYDILEGAEEFTEGKAEEITGIETPDDNTIVFNLTRPAGDWPHRLALPAASPVPQRYAAGFDRAAVSNYNAATVSSGPYYVKEWAPDQKVRLERNPYWEPELDTVRGAYVDAVDWEFGYGKDPEALTKTVKADVELIEGATIDQIVADPLFAPEVLSVPSLCTRFIWLNTTIAPFDKPLVRKAVAVAINRAKLKELQGGAAKGEIASSIVPPGLGGHLSAESYNPFRSKGTGGSVSKAKQMLAQAGLAGGSGAQLLLVGGSDPLEASYARSVRTDLEKIGFSNVKLRLVDVPKLYTDHYQQPDKEIAIGTSGGYCSDYSDASSFFGPLLHGDSIAPANNFNYAQIDDEALNKAIDKVAALLPGPERDAAWERVNRVATKSAALIPWSWDAEQIVLQKGLVNAIYNPHFSQIDWVAAAVGD